MNDEKFRLALHAAANDCLSGVERMPTQRAAVFERIDGTRRMVRRKTALVPVFAILLTLAIAGTAAAGIGLFGQLRAQKVDEVNYERLAHLEEAAAAVGQMVELGDGAQLSVDQAYCDGRKLYYSYTLTAPDANDGMYVGDGARLADGTYMNPVDSGMERTDDTMIAAYYELELPEGYAPDESVEFVLTVIDRRSGEMKKTAVNVTAPVTGMLRVLTGEGTVDGYTAVAQLYASDVDISGSVRIIAPQDYWLESYVLEAGGTEYRDIEGWSEYDGEAHVVNLRFDLPESLENMKLVPLDRAYMYETIELKETKGE